MRKTSEATSLLKSLHHHFSPHITSSQVTRVLPNYYGRQALCVILPTTHNPSSTLTASILFNRNQIPPLLSVCLSRAYKARPYPFQLLPNHHPHQEHSSHSDLWVPPTFLAHSSPGPLPYSHLLFILNSIQMQPPQRTESELWSQSAQTELNSWTCCLLMLCLCFICKVVIPTVSASQDDHQG